MAIEPSKRCCKEAPCVRASSAISSENASKPSAGALTKITARDCNSLSVNAGARRISNVASLATSGIFVSFRKASPTSRPFLGRSSRTFESIRLTGASRSAGMPIQRWLNRGASSNRIFVKMTIGCAPPNAASPVMHSNKTHPSANTSARPSTSLAPFACSGAMYPNVPTSVPVPVIRIVRSVHLAHASSTRELLDDETIRQHVSAAHDSRLLECRAQRKPNRRLTSRGKSLKKSRRPRFFVGHGLGSNPFTLRQDAVIMQGGNSSRIKDKHRRVRPCQTR